MFHKVFELEKYNIVSDENNFYFFRALNNGDNNDIKNSITINEQGQIERIRTDRERYQQEPEYQEDSTISLKEVFDHVKMHHSKDTNCISLTTNANVAALYGRGNYEDKYVMVKVPKDKIGKEVVNAGVYMMEEIIAKINDYKQNITNYIEDPDLAAKIIYSLTTIENSKNQIELEKNIENIKNSTLKEYVKEEKPSATNDIFEKGIDYTYENTSTVDYPALNEYQNFEKNKMIAMLDILKEDIITGVDNKFIIQTLGNAFSSLEFIHYKDIKSNEIIETPKEIIDIFALLQQAPDNYLVKELKQKVLNYNITNPNNIKKFKYDDNTINIENDYTIENMYNLTRGNLSFYEAIEVYKKSFYLSKSKLRTLSMIDLLTEITENDPKYSETIKNLKEKTYGIEPEIFSRNNKKKLQVSESVSLDFTKKEQSLFNYIDKLDNQDLEKIVNNPINALEHYLDNFNDIEEHYIDKDTYYANAIIDSYDWSKLNIVEFSPRRRNIIVNKLLEYPLIEIYNSLKEQGIKEKDIANVLLTTIIKEKDLTEEQINIKETFNKEELEYFLGFYQVKGTKQLRLRSYQAAAVKNINKNFETHDFTAAILPTGAGKSFIALSEMLQHKDEEILYLAPNDEILNQIQRYVLKYIYTKELSDKTQANLENKELIEDLTKEERELIKEVFPNLKLSTYQKLTGINKSEIIDKKYDFIIMDELHRTGAEEWTKRVEELLENQLKNQTARTKVLGITATPQRDYDNEDMANKWANFYGYTKEEIIKRKHLAANMDLEEAINQGLVVNPKVVSCTYSLLKGSQEIDDMKQKVEEEQDIHKKTKYRKTYQELRRKVNEAENLEQILGNNIKKGGRYIVFCPVVTEDENGYSEATYENRLKGTEAIEHHQKELTKLLQKYYNATEEEVNKMTKFNSMLGSYSKNKNRNELEKFENDDTDKIKFLTVMNKLNEGVHLENVDGIIWLRPLDENSKILFLQQFGRVIYSLNPNEELNNEKRPIVIDLVDNIANVRLDKGENQTNDLDRMHFIIDWIEEYDNKIPNINSADKVEAKYAEILKNIQEKYLKYLDKNTLNIMPENKKIEIEEILNLGKNVGLWNYQFPQKIKQTKTKSETEQEEFGLFSIIGELKDYVEMNEELFKQLTFEGKIADFIELLNTGYIPKSNDPNTKFSNGEKINYFWASNKEKIIEELNNNPKYETGYEIAKQIISNKSIDKIADFIELLNTGYIPKNKDPNTEFSNGEKINRFWASNKERIMEELNNNPKYETGYEIAKQIISNKSFDKIADFIELLNTGYIPKHNDPNTEFSNGEKINQFWATNKEKIIEELNNNLKYETGYEIAKQIVESKLEKNSKRKVKNIKNLKDIVPEEQRNTEIRR